MLSNLVNLSMQYYADPSRNRPLDGGKIFVGEVDKDPENFPIDVFYIEENGDEVLAAQPIIIGAGGIVMYNGKPVQIGTESAYSIRVRDSDDAQVYYIPDSAAADSSSQFTDMDPVFEMTLAEAVESTQIIEGLLLVISDRDLGYFQVVATSSVVPNGFDIIQCVGDPGLSLELRLTGIVSALAAGALLDWNGKTGTDDTLALQNLHSKLVSYTLRGRYALISAPLVMESDQTVDARGGGIHTTSTNALFTTLNTKTINFTLEGGSFTADGAATFARITGSNPSVISSNFLFNQCSASGFGICLTFKYVTECRIVGGSYSGKVGVSMQEFSSFISISNLNFNRDAEEIDGSVGSTSIRSSNASFDNVYFSKFEVALNIDDCDSFSFKNSSFIGEEEIGGEGGSLASLISDSVHIDITSCLFNRSPLTYVTPSEKYYDFNSKLLNCSFTETGATIYDIRIGKGCNRIAMTGCSHSLGDTTQPMSGKKGYLMSGKNEQIVIDSASFNGYELFAAFIVSGSGNQISNIINNDDIEDPLIIDYPINVYNVEGFNNSYHKEIDAIDMGNSAPGQTVFSIDNVVLSAGYSTIKLRINAPVGPFGGGLTLRIYDAGTLTTSTTVSTLQQQTNIANISPAPAKEYVFELTVLRATACQFKLVTHDGYASGSGVIWGGGEFGYEDYMSITQR